MFSNKNKHKNHKKILFIPATLQFVHIKMQFNQFFDIVRRDICRLLTPCGAGRNKMSAGLPAVTVGNPALVYIQAKV